MKTVILTLLGVVFLFVVCWIFISFLLWQVNFMKWGESTSFWALGRLAFMLFWVIYFLVRKS